MNKLSGKQVIYNTMVKLIGMDAWEVAHKMSTWAMVFESEGNTQEVIFKQPIGLSGYYKGGDGVDRPIAKGLSNIRTITQTNLEIMRESFGESERGWKPNLGVAVFIILDSDIGVNTLDDDVDFIELISPNDISTLMETDRSSWPDRIYYYKPGKQPTLPATWITERGPKLPSNLCLGVIDGMGRLTFSAVHDVSLIIHSNLWVIPS